MTDQEVRQAARKLMADCASAAVTSIDCAGYPHTAALLKVETDGLKKVWFTTSNLSGKADRIRDNPRACVYFVDFTGYRGLSLIGEMRVLEDRTSKERFWREGFERYYPQGVDTPYYCVLEFAAGSGQYFQGRPYELGKV